MESPTTRRRPRIVSSLALITALLAAPVLAGCTGQPFGEVLPSPSASIDISRTEVPDDFPSEVPLYDGDVLSGVGIGSGSDRIWNVGIRVQGADSLNEIQSELTDEGFDTTVQAGPGEAGGALVSSGSGYNVVVVVVQNEGGFTANYTVTAESG